MVPAAQTDYIPDELLFALTQPPQVSDSLGPPGRQRNLAVTNVSYCDVMTEDNELKKLYSY